MQVPTSVTIMQVLRFCCNYVGGTFCYTHVGGSFFAVTKVTVSVSCKLDWEEKLFDFYVESIALRIKMLINIALF